MTLREEIAKRLMRVEFRALPASVRRDLYGRTDLMPEDVHIGSTHLMMADECIRQMRWVQTHHRWANPETVPWETERGSIWEQEEVTLAPDGWPPKEEG